MQLLKPTTETRTKRAPRWLRTLQTITAIDALTAKGLEEFGTRDVVDEIDPRMSASTISTQVDRLASYHVLEQTTPPEQSRYRRWKVVDADKMHAWREALERHTGDGEPKLIDAAWEAAGEEAEVRHVVVERPPTEKPPLMQRLIAWLFRPLLDRIDAMLERQAAVERKLDGLLAEWQGGQPPTEES